MDFWTNATAGGDRLQQLQDVFSAATAKVNEGPAILQFVVPLLLAWSVLFAVDGVVTALVHTFLAKPSAKKKSQGAKIANGAHDVVEQHSGIFLGNGPIPINDTLALVLGAIMLIVLVPIVGGIVGLTVLWDFIDRGRNMNLHKN